MAMRTAARSVFTAIAVLGFGSVGCAVGADGGGWGGEVRDSSGVVIVENPTDGLWDEGDAWTLRLEREIGETDGAPEYTFGVIADVVLTSDGGVLVLDRQASTVRAYDSDGQFVRDIGGPGEGPGELGRFTYSLLLLSSDTLVVPDRLLSRFTLFGPDGGLVETVPLFGSPPSIRWGRLHDTRFVFRSLQNAAGDDGRVTSWDGLLTVDRSGMVQDTVLVVPENANIRNTAGGIGGPLAADAGFSAPLLIVAPVWSTLPDGRIAAAYTSDSEIGLYADDGALLRRIRSPRWERRSVSDRDADRLREMFLQRYTDAGMPFEEADSRFRSHLGMDRLPAFSQILAGPDGTLWVRRVEGIETIDPLALSGAIFDGLGSGLWDVLDSEGRYLGSVRLPDDFEPRSSHGDRIVGIGTDALGVQTVRVYRVERARGL